MSASPSNATLEVERSDLSRTRILEAPLAGLTEGSVRFRIERVALTANTVTYAVTGDQLGYWNFYPADAGWGRVPAMGWARVVESKCDGVPVGGRYYGWYPIARHVVVQAVATSDGLRDEGTHRAANAPVYRSFTRTDRDAFYEAGQDAEDRHALLRGLFITSFLADDFLADSGYFGASQVLLLSASSKTAIALAQCAAARKLGKVIGLTSHRNLGFVTKLPWYDSAVTYEDIESLPADVDTVSIDMSGNGEVLARVHAHYGDRLKHSMVIGRSHHDAPPRAAAMPGPRPAFFFAPQQVKKRIGDWGVAGYQQRLATALHDFVSASRDWLTVQRFDGPEEVTAAWRRTFDGKVGPEAGYIVSL